MPAHKQPIAGIAREDSDDELGVDDLPWEWIYEDTTTTTRLTSIAEDPTDEDDISSDDNDGRKRKKVLLSEGGNKKKKIIGARMGGFECQIGDAVLLKAEGSNEAWVGVICEFMDGEDGEKEANFMWFSTEQEIRNKEKKRTDFYWNELYLTPSWDVNPLASINGKAKISSWQAFIREYPTGKIPRQSPDFGKTFVCRRGCSTRTASYTDEFIWEELFRGPEDIFRLVEFIKNGTKASRRPRKTTTTTKPISSSYSRSKDKDYVNENNDDDDDDDDELYHPAPPQTPSKTGRGSTASTPHSKRGRATPGSRHKARLEFTPLATRTLDPTVVDSSPFQIARSRLHVSSIPTSLPCREAEFSLVYSHLEAAISDGTGNCIYISGTPGTGKTATVRDVIGRLEEAVGADELDDFIFVEINGMKITDPHHSYTLLWEALKGQRASPAQALDLLEREFGNPSPRRTPCVVLMDELDQLVTKNQAVMYNFFNWPTLRHSRLIVLAVANTMDLPERTLSNKISSRLGLTRITFPGYNHEQLMKIIQSRLQGVPNNMVDPDAIQFASRKVAAVSGDARRALDICRRAVELAEADSSSGFDPSTPSKTNRDDAINKAAAARGRVTIATVKRAINEATSNPTQVHLKSLPLMAKLLMAAVLLRMRRSGLVETTFGEVLDELHRANLRAPAGNSGLGYILPGVQRPTGVNVGMMMMGRPGQVHAAAVELVAAGLLNLEGHRAERSSKLRLAISDDEVKMALRDDAELRMLGIGV